MTKYVVQSSWAETPHLDEAAKAGLLSSYLPHELDARTKGLPSIGAGAIYPVPESEVICKPFEIPGWYRHVYALDVGWNRTAAIFGAHDPEDDVLYLYSEYYRAQAEPAVHAEAIKARGKWIPGVIDPAARGRSQHDGERLMTTYTSDLGLKLIKADNSRESGIYAVWTRLSTGRLKVFETCQNWRAEYRIYRRDEKGAIVKDNDHLMDGTRYLVASGLAIAAARPPETWPQAKKRGHQIDYDPTQEPWKAR